MQKINRLSVLFIVPVFLLTSCMPKEDRTKVNLLAPGNINTHMSERDAALSPDGQMFLFSVQLTRSESTICYSTKLNNKWIRPLVAEFSGKYMDIEPAFHPDGRLFFVSNRPLPGEADADDFNIWYTSQTDDGWTEPQPLDTIVNSPGNEFYPSFTSNGDMYFTATLPGGIGAEDIWVSKLVDGKYTGPENLGDSINTPNFEYNSFVSPDGSFLMLTTRGRGEGYGGGDLYISFKDEEGKWEVPVNMGPKVNTEGFEFCPSLSPDGKTLYFTRRNIPKAENERWSYIELISNASSLENGRGNIYYISSDFIKDLK